MCATTAYLEGTNLADLSTTSGQSYERRLGGILDSCQDAGDNSNDFQLITPSNPQNSSTPFRLCGGNADLRITQTVSNPTPAISSNVTFLITVYNDGTGDARSVEVRDVLPIGLTYAPSTATLGTYSNATNIWTVGTLMNGASATLSLIANVATGGAKTNTAEVWSSYDQDPDSTPGNGVTEDDLASVTVSPPSTGFADLSITKTVNNEYPNVNDSVVFSIAVSNTGPDVGTNVIVRDLLPAGLIYISHTSGETYTTGMWNVGTVPVGANTRILRITARLNDNAAQTNWAEIRSADQAPTDARIYGNNSTTEADDDDATVIPSGGIADLSLTQSAPIKSTVTAGYVVLTITVDNRAATGLYNATNVIVKDDLPTGLTYVSDDGGGTYNKDTGMWSAGGISNGASRSLKITVKVDPTGTMLNEAEIWSVDQFDPDSTPGDGSTNEDDDASVTVESADLSITKVMDNVTPIVGTDVVFTIRVTNAGPDTAENVVVKDKLSTNYTYLSDNGSYDPVTGYWTVGDIPNGATRTLNITATVVATTASTFTNWAEVWASDQVDTDSVPGDSSQSSDDDASAPAADLRIDQTIVSEYPGLNTEFTYTITVTNDGTVGATGVQVKDKLPSGVTYVSYTSTVGTYTSSTGYWVIDTLANSASATLAIKAKMTSAGARTNWAEVWKSSLPDPDSTPGNSSTTEDDDASATVYFRPILINEVAWAGTSSSLLDDQWIELYNPNSVSVDISGWTLTTADLTPNITLNGAIAAGGFFLLERDNNYTVSDITANQTYTGALLTSGETLTLRDGVYVIDTANISGGAWPKGGGSNYASMERQGNTAESDSVWVTNTGVTRNGKNASGGDIYGTPGKKNSTGIAPTPTPITIPPTAIPIVRPIINEFLARPGFDWNQDGKVDVFDEFIEIKNIGITDVNLKDWQLDDEEDSGSSPFKIPSLTLKPGQHAVFYALQTNILLSDGGDTVRLLNPGGKIYDAYTYPIAKAEDQSVCRLPDGNGSWYEDCVPTPNLINSREGEIPSMPGGGVFESPVCQLPDTLPADFLFAECRGYGADIWHSFYWDQFGWQGDQYVPENMSKWESFVE
ncbi:MAG: lamin tail domain-containing protein [Anaerolineales bacterium]|nr:lamin tail domain-containing protein [Anaerolineales bacterium]